MILKLISLNFISLISINLSNYEDILCTAEAELEHSKSAPVLCEHLEVCDVCRSEYSVEKNFRILDKGKNDFEITIK